MARTITQNLSLVAADPDGFSLNATDVGGPFPKNLLLDGVLATNNKWNGNAEIDLSANTMGVLVGFTTGTTGSTAVVTITGRDINGNPLTENVTMPGASSTASSVEVFSYISSMSIDGAYTNLSVGILAANTQFSKWTAFDTYQNPFKVHLDTELVSGTGTWIVDLTNDKDIFKPGNPSPADKYVAGTPFDTNTGSENSELIDTPAVAAQIRITTGSATVLRARYTQSGGGFR